MHTNTTANRDCQMTRFHRDRCIGEAENKGGGIKSPFHSKAIAPYEQMCLSFIGRMACNTA